MSEDSRQEMILGDVAWRLMRHFPVGKRVRAYERNQRNELSEDREPLCVHSVGNEAGEHSWWYLSFLRALATRMARAGKVESNHREKPLNAAGDRRTWIGSLAISASSNRNVLLWSMTSSVSPIEKISSETKINLYLSKIQYRVSPLVSLGFSDSLSVICTSLLSDFQDRILSFS